MKIQSNPDETLRTIKGRFVQMNPPGIHKTLVRLVLFVLLDLFVFLLLVLRDIPQFLETKSPNNGQVLFSTILIVGTVLYYFLVSGFYYYYQFDADHLIIRNRMRKYFNKVAFKDIVLIKSVGVSFEGKTRRDRLLFGYENSIQITFHKGDGSIETRQYNSSNLDPNDWEEFFVHLTVLNIPVEKIGT